MPARANSNSNSRSVVRRARNATVYGVKKARNAAFGEVKSLTHAAARGAKMYTERVWTGAQYVGGGVRRASKAAATVGSIVYHGGSSPELIKFFKKAPWASLAIALVAIVVYYLFQVRELDLSASSVRLLADLFQTAFARELSSVVWAERGRKFVGGWWNNRSLVRLFLEFVYDVVANYVVTVCIIVEKTYKDWKSLGALHVVQWIRQIIQLLELGVRPTDIAGQKAMEQAYEILVSFGGYIPTFYSIVTNLWKGRQNKNLQDEAFNALGPWMASALFKIYHTVKWLDSSRTTRNLGNTFNMRFSYHIAGALAFESILKIMIQKFPTFIPSVVRMVLSGFRCMLYQVCVRPVAGVWDGAWGLVSKKKKKNNTVNLKRKRGASASAQKSRSLPRRSALSPASAQKSRSLPRRSALSPASASASAKRRRINSSFRRK
jgi:hypothetical protein